MGYTLLLRTPLSTPDSRTAVHNLHSTVVGDPAHIPCPFHYCQLCYHPGRMIPQLLLRAQEPSRSPLVWDQTVCNILQKTVPG